MRCDGGLSTPLRSDHTSSSSPSNSSMLGRMYPPPPDERDRELRPPPMCGHDVFSRLRFRKPFSGSSGTSTDPANNNNNNNYNTYDMSTPLSSKLPSSSETTMETPTTRVGRALSWQSPKRRSSNKDASGGRNNSAVSYKNRRCSNGVNNASSSSIMSSNNNDTESPDTESFSSSERGKEESAFVDLLSPPTFVQFDPSELELVAEEKKAEEKKMEEQRQRQEQQQAQQENIRTAGQQQQNQNQQQQQSPGTKGGGGGGGRRSSGCNIMGTWATSLPSVREEQSFEIEEMKSSYREQNEKPMSSSSSSSDSNNNGGAFMSWNSNNNKSNGGGNGNGNNSNKGSASSGESSLQRIESNDFDASEQKEMLLTMRKLVIKQQMALKELSQENVRFRQELYKSQQELLESMKFRAKHQDSIDKLVFERESVQSEALWLREELKTVKSRIESMSTSEEDELKKKFERLMNDTTGSNRPSEVDASGSGTVAFQKFKEALMVCGSEAATTSTATTGSLSLQSRSSGGGNGTNLALPTTEGSCGRSEQAQQGTGTGKATTTAVTIPERGVLRTISTTTITTTPEQRGVLRSALHHHHEEGSVRSGGSSSLGSGSGGSSSNSNKLHSRPSKDEVAQFKHRLETIQQKRMKRKMSRTTTMTASMIPATKPLSSSTTKSKPVVRFHPTTNI